MTSASSLRPLALLLSVSVLMGVSRGWTVSGVTVHNVPLQRDSKDSPYCLASSSAVDLNEKGSRINFLATQVWPSARVAAAALQQHLDPCWLVCELGCGPGLPSLTAAKLGASKVIATDIDPFALKLVEEAASAQDLQNIAARQFDLTAVDELLPKADLFLLSDVFESGKVATGAAHVTRKALSNGARVWVFAQTDRAQREVYLEELRKIYDPTLSWRSMDEFDPDEQLWLCDVDEGNVNYG